MNKIPIVIPDDCIPDSTIILGYSGGMALYVIDWHSVMFLFKLINIPKLAYTSIANNNILN